MPLVEPLVDGVEDRAAALDDVIHETQIAKVGAARQEIDPRAGKEHHGLQRWFRVLRQEQIRREPLVTVAGIQRDLLFGPVLARGSHRFDLRVERRLVVRIQAAEDSERGVGDRPGHREVPLQQVPGRHRFGGHRCGVPHAAESIQRRSVERGECLGPVRAGLAPEKKPEVIRRAVPGPLANISDQVEGAVCAHPL